MVPGVPEAEPPGSRPGSGVLDGAALGVGVTVDLVVASSLRSEPGQGSGVGVGAVTVRPVPAPGPARRARRAGAPSRPRRGPGIGTVSSADDGGRPGTRPHRTDPGHERVARPVEVALEDRRGERTGHRPERGPGDGVPKYDPSTALVAAAPAPARILLTVRSLARGGVATRGRRARRRDRSRRSRLVTPLTCSGARDAGYRDGRRAGPTGSTASTRPRTPRRAAR